MKRPTNVQLHDALQAWKRQPDAARMAVLRILRSVRYNWDNSYERHLRDEIDSVLERELVVS